MYQLLIKDLQVFMGGKKILKGINLEVREGELVSLLGPSGCGKSTLLKTTAGLIIPDCGEIYINDRPMAGVLPEKRGTVIVFQDLRLFPNMNVLENVEFGLKMKGIHWKERKKKALDMLQRVELAGFEDRKVQELSGGQKQRVALARAMAVEPGVLFLDEPFSSLDEMLKVKMRELVMKLQRELRITSIMVTHDQEEALLMSDRIAIMSEGSIIQFDIPRKVYQNPATPQVADYFGKVNYIEGIVEEGMFKSTHFSFKTSCEEGLYKIMLRPGNIRILEGPGDYKITSVCYLGEKFIVGVSGFGSELLINESGNKLFKVGMEISLEFDLSKGVLYKVNK